MTIRINEADTAGYSIDITGCEDPESLVIASLISQTLDFHYTYINRHHGIMAGTITDLVEHINDGI